MSRDILRASRASDEDVATLVAILEGLDSCVVQKRDNSSVALPERDESVTTLNERPLTSSERAERVMRMYTELL